MCRDPGCSDEEPVLLAGIYRATMLLHNPGARPRQMDSPQPSQPNHVLLVSLKAASCNSWEVHRCARCSVHAVRQFSPKSCVGCSSEGMRTSQRACARGMLTLLLPCAQAAAVSA